MVLPLVWCSVTPAPVAQGTGLAARTCRGPQSCPSPGCSKTTAVTLLLRTPGQEERQGLVRVQADLPVGPEEACAVLGEWGWGEPPAHSCAPRAGPGTAHELGEVEAMGRLSSWGCRAVKSQAGKAHSHVLLCFTSLLTTGISTSLG